MKWTVEQQAAIEAPRPGSLPSQTLLVAAAAGSGKTAVLVERILKRLQDKEHPLRISELMVVTFTKAAAAEMRARIGSKLAEEFERTQDPYLEEQLNLLPSAHISTLHSFCQWVIRSYFYCLDIDPSFRVGNEGELTLLRAEVMDGLFLEAYEQNLYQIYDLVDMLGEARSDSAVKQHVQRLYDFAMAQPAPSLWLKGIGARYAEAATKPPQETLWGQAFWEEQQILLKEIKERYAQMMQLITVPGGPHAWDIHVTSVAPLMERLYEAKTWDAMHEAVRGIEEFSFKTYSKAGLKKGLASGEIEQALVDRVESLGKTNKDLLKKMVAGPFAVSEADFAAQLAQQLPYVEGLLALAEAFMDRYKQAKRDAGIIDFSDLEHLCLALLCEPGTEAKPQPSAVAKELQGLFKEVMVDEYQDTNGVQEAIVNLVSREDNRFYVGDVKQSIYRFRMADPSLFMDKYKTFGRDLEAVTRRLDLAKNFRSHENILEVTNFLFRQIMTEEAAELTYGDDEALYAGRTVENPPSSWVGGAVELHLLEVGDGADEADEADSVYTAEESEEEEPENDEKEMAFIIAKIKEMKEQNATVQDKDGSFRPIAWRDIVILLRSLAGKANRMVEALRAAGIPAYAEENTGYFSALEVQLLLALLQIIDNPEQDLPMAAVLRSAFVGLDTNELGRLRAFGTGTLWQLLPAFAENQNHQGLRDFLTRFEGWRTLSRQKGVSDLLWQIFEDTYYVEYVSAMPNGLVRRANVLALYERAKQYEAGSFRGLFRFLRFIESLQQAGQDLGLAKTVSEADDVVRIMSIHKSKGLEFPVVFVSSVQKKFNMRDLTSPLLLDKEAGLGLKGYYPTYRVLYESLPWRYGRDVLAKAAKAEEERILYVALTRAKDKLFLTGYVKNLGARCQKVLAPVLAEEKVALPTKAILGANSYLDWLLMSFGRHLEGNVLRVMADVEEAALPDNPHKRCRLSITVHDGHTFRKETASQTVLAEDLTRVRLLSPADEAARGGEGLAQALVERFTYEYPYAGAVQQPAKVSVTELKRRFALQEEEALQMTTQAEVVAMTASHLNGATESVNSGVEGLKEPATKYPAIASALTADEVGDRKEALATETGEALWPAFTAVPQGLADTTATMRGARWGTIVHTVMQWLPRQAYTLGTLRQELDHLVWRGYLTEDERARLPVGYLWPFFQSDLYQRLLRAQRLESEWPFSLLLEAKTVFPEVEAGEEIFVQGIIDMVFMEDGAWVLVDYKTDKVGTAETLRRRYAVQLRLYAKALTQLTGYPVKEALLYSFSLKETVRVF